jgi:cellulose biosynthesis protein BcsQ
MRVVSIFNMKGGVGKTAATVNLGYLAAKSGKRVLIWDLDPQGATSFYFRIKPKIKGGGKKLVKGKSDIDSLIKGTDFEGLDLLPSDFSYREMDVRLSREKQSHLKRLIAPLREDYDLVIFDCPPSMSELSEQIFRASDILLVPLIPTTLSLRTLAQIREFLKSERIPGLRLRTFYSMVDRRKKMHRELIEAPDKAASGGLEAAIPYSSLVERMGEERRPVADFAPRSAPAAAFEALWREVEPLLA